jgi:hypothetical protein
MQCKKNIRIISCSYVYYFIVQSLCSKRKRQRGREFVLSTRICICRYTRASIISQYSKYLYMLLRTIDSESESEGEVRTFNSFTEIIFIINDNLLNSSILPLPLFLSFELVISKFQCVVYSFIMKMAIIIII